MTYLVGRFDYRCADGHDSDHLVLHRKVRPRRFGRMEERVLQQFRQVFDHRCNGAGRGRARRPSAGRHPLPGLFRQSKNCRHIIPCIMGLELTISCCLFAENDERQQLGATFGCVRDDGQRHCHLFGQNWNADYQQDDGRQRLHGRTAPQNHPQIRTVARQRRSPCHPRHRHQQRLHILHYGAFHIFFFLFFFLFFFFFFFFFLSFLLISIELIGL